jgi:hypothetical protein
MVNEKTSIVKFDFSENKLTLMADTPDSGASEDEIEIEYSQEELKIRKQNIFMKRNELVLISAKQPLFN